MNAPITITLTGTPTGKGRHRFGSGRAYTPAKTATYQAALRLAAQIAMDGRPPLEGPVRCDVHAVFVPAKRWSKKKRAAALIGRIWPTKKPDRDNIDKIVGDSLNGVVFLDDKQICDGRITKRFGEVAGIEIAVSELPGEGL